MNILFLLVQGSDHIFNTIQFLRYTHAPHSFTWGFLQNCQSGGWGGGVRGSEKLLIDGYIYPDSDFTEWKLVVLNLFTSNFLTIP